ncbi:MAG TPA: hypothetical protein PKA10_19615 [Selenomonadales bacterium]|nr:hypothetical protein [Selenomonadales bacterium]
MNFLVLLLVLIIAAAVVIWLYVARQGDAEFEFIVDQRTDFRLTELTAGQAVFSCVVPFVNKGTQDGTIMDCYPRHLLPREQFDAVKVESRLALESRLRDDGYFEALIVPKTTGGNVVLTVVLTVRQGDIRATLAEMVDMSLDIVYQVVARSRWYIHKQRLVMTAEEITRALSAGPTGA